jgi:hypothetical protein
MGGMGDVQTPYFSQFELSYPPSTEPFKSELKAFRHSHAAKNLLSQGNQWTYFAGGQGDETLDETVELVLNFLTQA